MKTVEALLDQSIAAQGYLIRDPAEKFEERWIDLSQIDFKELKAQFDKGRKRIEVEKLKARIQAKLAQMIVRNKSRVDYLEKFQRMIEEYNAGSYNTELFFKKLMDFARELNEEEKRGIAEQLNEEELAIFDLLTKPEMSLTKKEKMQVKKVARELLETLKNGKLVLDWRKRQQARAAVRLCIEEILYRLPRAYTPDIYQTKCEAVYQHVYDSYYGRGRSIYTAVT
jgi:type I restriction enzyme R subunit